MLCTLKRSHIIELPKEATIIHAYYVYNITYVRIERKSQLDAWRAFDKWHFLLFRLGGL
jgi:hypothetical protein